MQFYSEKLQFSKNSRTFIQNDHIPVFIGMFQKCRHLIRKINIIYFSLAFLFLAQFQIAPKLIFLQNLYKLIIFVFFSNEILLF